MTQKTLIIGSGPAGCTAAIYASRSGLSPVVYEGILPGGQLTQTTEIENFPGYPEGTTGFAMMDDLKAQAERLGAEFRDGNVERVELSADGSTVHRVIFDDGSEERAYTLIVSTGASAKYLGLEDEAKYAGRGVSACATCDGFFYKGRTVAVVGGGDTACEEAQYLAGLASKVYMIVRRDRLRASEAMQSRVKKAGNIELMWNTQVAGIYGEKKVEGLHLVRNKGEEAGEELFDLPVDGLFLAIGHHPNSEMFSPMVDVDEEGYIKIQHPTTATNVPGVFAAGDVADPIYRQAISAAGSGCHAAIDALRYLQEKGLA